MLNPPCHIPCSSDLNLTAADGNVNAGLASSSIRPGRESSEGHSTVSSSDPLFMDRSRACMQ